MANKSITVGLKCDTSDYDKKLKDAKKKTKSFSQEGKSGMAEFASSFTKFAGAVAASKVVMDTFKAVIASSQTIGDAYAKTLHSAKGAVNEFVYAIANADFSGFNGGLRNIIGNAREAAASMDALGNAQISYDYLTAGYRASFKENVKGAKDKSISAEERKAYLAAAQQDLEKMNKAVIGYSDKTIKAVVDNAVEKANNVSRAFVTRENIDRIMELDLLPGGEERKKQLADQYEIFKELSRQEAILERAVNNTAVAASNAETHARNQAKLEELRARINSDEMQLSALYNAMLVKGTDEWLKEMTQYIIKADNAKASYAEMSTSIFEVVNQLNQPIKSGTVGEVLNPKHKVGNLSLYGGNTSASELPSRISGYAPTAYFAEGSYEAYIAAQGAAREYADALAVLDNTSLSASEGLGAISGAMGNLSGMLGEGAGAWMNYAGGIVSAVSSALPALESLAAAQAAAAVTKTALSPWTVISGIAAVTSIIAAMSQLPKFATGGVVPGNALSGDNVLIRANSGEVVLTKQQANNIGSALAGLGGNVRFVIEGDKLVGVLNNHNRITSRSYGN